MARVSPSKLVPPKLVPLRFRECVVALAAVAGLLFGAFGSSASAATIDKVFTETFDVRDGARLVLHHGDGNASFEAWDRNQVDVEVRYRADTRKVGVGKVPEFDVDFRQRGDTITVREKGGGHSVVIGMIATDVHEYTYTVRAPSWVELSLRGDDGSVDLRGWRAPVEIEAEDGSVKLEDVRAREIRVNLEDGDLDARGLEGDLEVSTDDGGVLLVNSRIGLGRIQSDDGRLELEGCSGDLEIRSEDGNVRLRDHGQGPLRIRTSDGGLEVALAQPGELDLDLSSEDGTITLLVPRGSSAMMEIRTDDGRVDVDLPGVELRGSEERRLAKIGSGKGTVFVRTEDGSVRVRETESRDRP